MKNQTIHETSLNFISVTYFPQINSFFDYEAETCPVIKYPISQFIIQNSDINERYPIFFFSECKKCKKIVTQSPNVLNII